MALSAPRWQGALLRSYLQRKFAFLCFPRHYCSSLPSFGEIFSRKPTAPLVFDLLPVQWTPHLLHSTVPSAHCSNAQQCPSMIELSWAVYSSPAAHCTARKGHLDLDSADLCDRERRSKLEKVVKSNLGCCWLYWRRFRWSR